MSHGALGRDDNDCPEMKILLYFTIFSSLALLNDGFGVKNAVSSNKNQLKTTQLNLFGRKKAIVDAVVKSTVTTGKDAKLIQAITGKQAVAGATAGAAATSVSSCGLCGVLTSVKLKLMNIFTSLIGIYLLIITHYSLTC